jgi:hypothetical protein
LDRSRDPKSVTEAVKCGVRSMGLNFSRLCSCANAELLPPSARSFNVGMALPMVRRKFLRDSVFWELISLTLRYLHCKGALGLKFGFFSAKRSRSRRKTNPSKPIFAQRRARSKLFGTSRGPKRRAPRDLMHGAKNGKAPKVSCVFQEIRFIQQLGPGGQEYKMK